MGRYTVVMAGMPQGRDINEAGAKSVSLVTIADDRSVQVEERITSVAQFERVCVDVTNIDNWTALVRDLGRSVERTQQGAVVGAAGGPPMPDRHNTGFTSGKSGAISISLRPNWITAPRLLGHVGSRSWKLTATHQARWQGYRTIH